MKYPSGFPHKKGVKKADPTRGLASIGSLMASVGESLGLDVRAQELALCQLWKTVVDPQYQEMTRAIGVVRHAHKQGVVLKIQVENPTLAVQMSFSKQDYLQKLNQFAPQTGLWVQDLQWVPVPNSRSL